MKRVEGRAEARWLPSRYNFSLFRLIAFLRLRRAPTVRAEQILFIDRHQSGFETYAVATWLVLTVTCYIASLLRLRPAFALLVALPLSFIALQVALVGFGVLLLLTRRRADASNIRLDSALVMLLLFAAAAYFATRPTWVRFAAWQFLAFAAVNACAAVIVFLLRAPIARLEKSVVGGEASDA